MKRSAVWLTALWLASSYASGADPQADSPGSQSHYARPATAVANATPDWFSVGAQYRFRFENRTGSGFRKGTADGFGLNRVLVDIGIRPKSWLSFYFQGQDARAPGKKNATPFFRDPFDVRQAWVTLGDPESGWIRVKVGRQEHKYGAQRVIGPLDWSNTARQFDAVKVNVGKKDLNVDIFASSLVVTDDEGFNRSKPGQNLHGAYSNLNRLVKKGSLEAYGLWKTNPQVIGETGALGSLSLFTTGFRLTQPLPNGFDVETEVAGQFGSFAGDDISAWGGYWILGHTVQSWRWTPRFSVEYQYGSGDNDPNDGKIQTFDQLYPTAHLFQGTADQVGWRNVSDVRAGASIKPHKALTLTFDYFSFWLANKNDGLYNAGGRLIVAPPDGGAENSHIGQELDAIMVWKPAAHVTFGGGFGYLFTGKFLQETTPGHRHTFGYLFVNYVL